MAKPRKPRSATAKGPSKADKPELQPLDPFLADLLNPALNRNRLPERPGRVPEKRGRRKAEAPGGPQGFGEAPQAGFTVAPGAEVDPRLAQALGLTPPEDGPAPEGAPDASPLDAGGASATVAALEQLLTEGNPLFKNGAAWVPHRPERPKKSEAG